MRDALRILLLLLLLCCCTRLVSLKSVEAFVKSTDTAPIAPPPPPTLKIIFSDIDGSLIHYPSKQKQTTQLQELNDHNNNKNNKNNKKNNDDQILELPPSATGLKGIISSKTLETCRDLRQFKKGIKLVLVTGARTSTLLNRLPYLPKADAYCTEAGGRIFYPIEIDDDDDEFPNQNQSQFIYTPLEYKGAQPEDLIPFRLREDKEWRTQMEIGGAGKEGYVGNEISSNRCSDKDYEDEEVEECLIEYENTAGFPLVEDEIPVCDRKGNLWEYANHLVQQKGFVLDTKSYSTCFRVNKKHQQQQQQQMSNNNSSTKTITNKFEALLKGDIQHPETTIGKSVNLGCIDFYPSSSGKGNCCRYIANQLGIQLATESVCICDDDNDIEMAVACGHSYIPSLSSTTMIKTLEGKNSTFTQTFGPGIAMTAATDVALDLIYNLP